MPGCRVGTEDYRTAGWRKGTGCDGCGRYGLQAPRTRHTHPRTAAPALALSQSLAGSLGSIPLPPPTAKARGTGRSQPASPAAAAAANRSSSGRGRRPTASAAVEASAAAERRQPRQRAVRRDGCTQPTPPGRASPSTHPLLAPLPGPPLRHAPRGALRARTHTQPSTPGRRLLLLLQQQQQQQHQQHQHRQHHHHHPTPSPPTPFFWPSSIPAQSRTAHRKCAGPQKGKEEGGGRPISGWAKTRTHSRGLLCRAKFSQSTPTLSSPPTRSVGLRAARRGPRRAAPATGLRPQPL
eukprot:scaffold6237_cov336-Prasinococcus_capsulatus_cf.AAC.1